MWGLTKSAGSPSLNHDHLSPLTKKVTAIREDSPPDARMPSSSGSPGYSVSNLHLSGADHHISRFPAQRTLPGSPKVSGISSVRPIRRGCISLSRQDMCRDSTPSQDVNMRLQRASSSPSSATLIIPPSVWFTSPAGRPGGFVYPDGGNTASAPLSRGGPGALADAEGNHGASVILIQACETPRVPICLPEGLSRVPGWISCADRSLSHLSGGCEGAPPPREGGGRTASSRQAGIALPCIRCKRPAGLGRAHGHQSAMVSKLN